VPETVLEARGLTMEFPGVKALDAVDFSLARGEVHALMGENGAGKSTLIKVLSGLYQPSAGRLEVGGRPLRPRSPRDAEAAGISTVHQEIDLIPSMSVADNIALGRQPTRLGFIRRRLVLERARRALARLELSLDVTKLLGDCSIALQQLVAIARALDIDARVLILDEPTSSLDAGETRELFRVVSLLKDQGLAVVFITHFLDHVDQIADRITVLRNGRRVGTWDKADLPRPALIEAMTGRTIASLEASVNAAAHAAAAGPAGEPLLDARGVARRRALAPVDVAVHAGETVGLAGLLGSGRSELARLLFGADARDAGTVRIAGTPVEGGSVRAAIREGVAMCPEDRKKDGLVLDLSARENIILALQARRGPLAPIAPAEQRRLADHYTAALRIKAPSIETPVRTLSVGNQQKVLLARWLAMQPRVLILDEPTRGIDVGAKAEIEALVADLKAQGLAIVFISAEIDELLRTCSRVLVLRDRTPVGELAGDALDEAAILRLIAAPTAGGAP
jgi:simple sugar transport system ATP-binding protein